jgi:hypothetical protein
VKEVVDLVSVAPHKMPLELANSVKPAKLAPSPVAVALEAAVDLLSKVPQHMLDALVLRIACDGTAPNGTRKNTQLVIVFMPCYAAFISRLAYIGLQIMLHFERVERLPHTRDGIPDAGGDTPAEGDEVRAKIDEM